MFRAAREAKRAGRKTRAGGKTRHKCLHTFPPPFVRRDAQGNLTGPPNSPGFSVVGLCRVRPSILGRGTGDFQRMKTSPCQAGDPGCKGRGRAKFRLAQEINDDNLTMSGTRSRLQVERRWAQAASEEPPANQLPLAGHDGVHTFRHVQPPPFSVVTAPSPSGQTWWQDQRTVSA